MKLNVPIHFYIPLLVLLNNYREPLYYQLDESNGLTVNEDVGEDVELETEEGTHLHQMKCICLTVTTCYFKKFVSKLLFGKWQKNYLNIQIKIVWL